jgi:hypothetical protein
VDEVFGACRFNHDFYRNSTDSFFYLEWDNVDQNITEIEEGT